jgi:hypothetical protein
LLVVGVCDVGKLLGFSVVGGDDGPGLDTSIGGCMGMMKK